MGRRRFLELKGAADELRSPLAELICPLAQGLATIQPTEAPWRPLPTIDPEQDPMEAPATVPAEGTPAREQQSRAGGAAAAPGGSGSGDVEAGSDDGIDVEAGTPASPEEKKQDLIKRAQQTMAATKELFRERQQRTGIAPPPASVPEEEQDPHERDARRRQAHEEAQRRERQRMQRMARQRRQELARRTDGLVGRGKCATLLNMPLLVGAQIVLQYGVWTLHSDTALTCGIVALCLLLMGSFCLDNCFIRPVTEANTGFQRQIFGDWNSQRTDKNRKMWKYCSTFAVGLGCVAVAWASAGCPSSDEGFAIGAPAFPALLCRRRPGPVRRFLTPSAVRCRAPIAGGSGSRGGLHPRQQHVRALRDRLLRAVLRAARRQQQQQQRGRERRERQRGRRGAAGGLHLGGLVQRR